jgi:hypothetical protein
MRIPRLAIEIATLLLLKAALLFALWAAFFSPAHRVHIDPAAVQAHLAP